MKISVDVYLNKRFYHSLAYNWNTMFGFDIADVMSYVYEKLPLLKYRKDVNIVLDI